MKTRQQYIKTFIELREISGFTIAEFARKLGVPTSKVNNICSGAVAPSMDLLAAAGSIAQEGLDAKNSKIFQLLAGIQKVRVSSALEAYKREDKFLQSLLQESKH